MYKKLFIDTIVLSTFICLFGYVMGIYLNIFEIPFIQQKTTNGITMTTFNTMDYIRNIELAFTNVEQLKLDLPQKQWISVGGGDWFEDLAHNLAVMLDWGLLMPINIAFFPIRILAYVIRGIMSMVGAIAYTTKINGITYQPEWFMNLTNQLMSFQINYV